MHIKICPNRGDIYCAQIDYSDHSGYKTRPIIIVSANPRNATADDVLAVTCTGSEKRPDIHGNVKITHPGLSKETHVSCGNLQLVHKSDLRDKIGQLGEAEMAKISNGILYALGLSAPAPAESTEMEQLKREMAEINSSAQAQARMYKDKLEAYRLVLADLAG